MVDQELAEIVEEQKRRRILEALAYAEQSEDSEEREPAGKAAPKKQEKKPAPAADRGSDKPKAKRVDGAKDKLLFLRGKGPVVQADKDEPNHFMWNPDAPQEKALTRKFGGIQDTDPTVITATPLVYRREEEKKPAPKPKAQAKPAAKKSEGPKLPDNFDWEKYQKEGLAKKEAEGAESLQSDLAFREGMLGPKQDLPGPLKFDIPAGFLESISKPVKEVMEKARPDLEKPTPRASWAEYEKILNAQDPDAKKEGEESFMDIWGPLLFTLGSGLAGGMGSMGRAGDSLREMVKEKQKLKVEAGKGKQDKQLERAKLFRQYEKDGSDANYKDKRIILDAANAEVIATGKLSQATAQLLAKKFGFEAADAKSIRDQIGAGQRNDADNLQSGMNNDADNQAMIEKAILAHEAAKELAEFKRKAAEDEAARKAAGEAPKKDAEVEATKAKTKLLEEQAKKTAAEAANVGKGKAGSGGGKGSGRGGAGKGPEPKADQWKAAGFARRLQQAEEIFTDLSSKGYDRSSRKESLRESWLPEEMHGDRLRSQSQAERNFVNAVLRRESGAAISPSEFESAEKQYFDRPGDSPETKAQKRANRQQIIANMVGESGSALDRIPYVSPIAGGSSVKGGATSLDAKKALLKKLYQNKNKNVGPK